MKLSEIKQRKNPSVDLAGCDWFDESIGSKVDVKIEYNYEPADHADHPYGEGTAREEFPAEIEIVSCKLSKKAELADDDGEPTGKFLEAGFDLAGDKKYWNKWIESQAEAAVEKEL